MGRHTEQPLSPALWDCLAQLHVAHTCQADLHGVTECDQGLGGQEQSYTALQQLNVKSSLFVEVFS